MRRTVRIYRPTPPEGFEWALPVDDADFEVLQTLGVEPRATDLGDVEMYLLKVDDRGRAQRRASMPWLGSHVLVLRDEAIESVGPLLRSFGELVSVTSADARLAVFGAATLEGALDEERSEIVRFGSGRIMDLRAPVFRPEVVTDIGAFKLAEMPRGDLYLTGDLVDAIRGTGMTAGTDFKLVHDAGH